MTENQVRAESSKNIIMQALFENGELRYKELEEKTGLSSPTLTKRLKAMEKSGIIKRVLHVGEKWPYYTLDSPEHLKEFILPQVIWTGFNENYPSGASFEKIATNFGETLLCLLFKEKTKNRSHDMAIRGLIKIMRNSVNAWAEKGVNIVPQDFEGYYRAFVETDIAVEELHEMREEIFEKAKQTQQK